jgi:FixJ family two-component response regulator
MSRVVFISGGAFTPSASGFIKATARPLLEKPIDPELLRRAVLRVIRENRPKT